jgi:hypothetical protein
MDNTIYVGTTEAASRLGISSARLRVLLNQGRIKGAKKEGRTWQIPLFNEMPMVTEKKRGPKGNWENRARRQTSILVNQDIIDRNSENGANVPPLVLQRGLREQNCHELIINGPCRLVYVTDPDDPDNVSLCIEVDPSVPVVTKTLDSDD